MIDIQTGKALNTPSLVSDHACGEEVIAGVIKTAGEILNARTLSATRLAQGGNNVTLMIETPQGQFVAKHYPTSLGDLCDRYAAETGALRFMNAHAFDCVPTLIDCDAEARVAVMDGQGKAAAIDAVDADIKTFTIFAERLHSVRLAPDAENLDAAAEACLAPLDIIRQVRARRKRLACVTDDHDKLGEFLNTTFDPALDRYEAAGLNTLEAAGISADTPLARDRQTLNPSDLGLHNAVRRDDGQLVFVDFEYFGWDDPIRLVSDFLLHPGHILTDAQKRAFATSCTKIFATKDTRFHERLNALYPLIGSRWCMILLNEFLPERMQRRRAAGNTDETEDVLAKQLNKAHQLFAGLEDSKRLVTN